MAFKQPCLCLCWFQGPGAGQAGALTEAEADAEALAEALAEAAALADAEALALECIEQQAVEGLAKACGRPATAPTLIFGKSCKPNKLGLLKCANLQN